MKIGIIGKGRVGSALQSGLTRAGHIVRIGGRSTQVSLPDIVNWADAIILAVPFSAIEDIAAQIGPCSDKIIIDCTNPIAPGPDGMGLSIGHTSSGAEHLQALLPDARIVKTLNQVGAEVMADTSGFVHKPVQLLAGNDDEAKQLVAGLLLELGFEPLDTGGLSKARLLEPFALVWINQSMAQKKGRDWAFGAMPRERTP